MPIDLTKREKLRTAQADESRALSDCCQAQRQAERATARRDKVMAELTASVDQAEAELGAVMAVLVEVSGIDRAARLLETTTLDLRRVVHRKPGPQIAGAT
jgi:hypothetical protein